ncbi:hypothetical protein B296_00005290 [Ensete ventricosum]|uniref:Uncharacterized protein n=1 Tax=Ensete ventricosum TaxID=4639 RepID=A0A426YZK8_ENSVE|nr:hypothetical protein B296_00005290 [Ensete ventricosum]
MGGRTSTISQKTQWSYTMREVVRGVKFRSVFRALVEFRSVFRAPTQKFKILAILNVLPHGKSYEHCFLKNTTVKNFARSLAQSGVSIGFSCTVSKIQNTGHS